MYYSSINDYVNTDVGLQFVREENIIGKFISKDKMYKHQFFGASFSPINEFYWTSGLVV
jgi:hypothetical protein